MRWYQLSTCILLPFLAARASPQSIAVYLHPTPAVHSHSVPTLSPAQAKAVLAHHLGETIDVFEEIPADEGLWGHLIGMWKGENEGGKAKVVVIEGGISPQGERGLTFPNNRMTNHHIQMFSQQPCHLPHLSTFPRPRLPVRS